MSTILDMFKTRSIIYKLDLHDLQTRNVSFLEKFLEKEDSG